MDKVRNSIPSPCLTTNNTLVQAPTGKPVSQISVRFACIIVVEKQLLTIDQDGQVQAPTSKPAMTTGKPVSQIGQVSWAPFD